MSLSTMNKATYKAHMRSIRDNGTRYTLAHIVCPFEREDMAFLENQAYDHLLQRHAFRTLGEVETRKNAFLLTTLLKAKK